MKVGEVDGKKIGCTVSLLVSTPRPSPQSLAFVVLQKYCVLFGFSPVCFYPMFLRRV